jgi:hypothetical protein
LASRVAGAPARPFLARWGGEWLVTAALGPGCPPRAPGHAQRGARCTSVALLRALREGQKGGQAQPTSEARRARPPSRLFTRTNSTGPWVRVLPANVGPPRYARATAPTTTTTTHHAPGIGSHRVALRGATDLCGQSVSACSGRAPVPRLSPVAMCSRRHAASAYAADRYLTRWDEEVSARLRHLAAELRQGPRKQETPSPGRPEVSTRRSASPESEGRYGHSDTATRQR